ncbi:MAG TPA: hypothetical protein VJZ01_05120 [Lachnospiraceae bacterium]|nr:hypothetical protein [Lachnospiraceae bacterium]
MRKRAKTLIIMVCVSIAILLCFCLYCVNHSLKTNELLLKAISNDQKKIVELIQDYSDKNAQHLDKVLYSMERMLSADKTEQSNTTSGLGKIENMLYAIKKENTLLTERIEANAHENTQITYEMNSKISDIQSLLETEADNTIIDILTETASHDYIEKGLEYYTKKEYLPAYLAFSRALQYNPNNTTVVFYQIYCLYLGSHTKRLDLETCQIIQSGIETIREYGFKSIEQIGFTETDMLQTITAIETNINEQ